MFAPALPVPLTLSGRGLQFARNPFRQHLLPLLFTYSAVLLFAIPGTYLANLHQCDRFLSRIYGNA
ncbi:hypothetical protein DTL72_18595 [Escherichia coli]|nr:hypothetical protein CDC27_19910 [Escherichia coli]EFN9793559.1 hypothetical protein [Escherichia coli]RCP14973.1 hypothetical protein A6587_13295 [Escherichia coli]RCX60506.1 hypothetical protein DTL38_17845 [Escherichia coli]RCY39925.1 hypothetical protein DTL77_16790 [Escherichia coli]